MNAGFWDKRRISDLSFADLRHQSVAPDLPDPWPSAARISGPAPFLPADISFGLNPDEDEVTALGGHLGGL